MFLGDLVLQGLVSKNPPIGGFFIQATIFFSKVLLIPLLFFLFSIVSFS